MKLNKLIRILFYILAIVLPIQTVIVKFLTAKIGFPEWIATWKEAVIVVIILYLIYEITTVFYSEFKKQNRFDFFKYIFKYSYLLLAFLVLNLVIIINSFVFNSSSLKVFLFGYRFEIFWLGFFVVVATYLLLPAKKSLLESLDLEPVFYKNLKNSVFAGFVISASFTFVSLIFGPSKVLGFVGFGSTQTEGLITQSIVCNPVDYGSSSCRLSGSFASPNHFAGYLLLILPVFLVTFIDYFLKWHDYHKNFKTEVFAKKSPIWNLLLISLAIVILSLFLLLTVSRFALLGIAVFLGLIVIYFGYQFKIFNLKIAKTLLGFLLFIPILIGVVAINIHPDQTAKYLPTTLAKPSSTIEHYRHTTASLEVLTASKRYVQGFGLAASGSVATDQYQDLDQNPIYKDYGYIAFKYYMYPERITIPENWYISVFLNGGAIYFLLYLGLVFYPIFGFYKFFKGKKFEILDLKYLLFTAGFFSILIGNLFLHIWENQTIAIYWTLLFILMFASENKTKLR